MKTRFLSLLGCAVLGLAVTVGTTACDKQGNAKVTTEGNVKLTPANLAKLSKDMTFQQVVALFGQPTTPGEVKDRLVYKTHTDTWVEGKESLSVNFDNDKVTEFHSTVGSTTATTSSDGSTTKTTTTTTKQD